MGTGRTWIQRSAFGVLPRFDTVTTDDERLTRLEDAAANLGNSWRPGASGL